MRRKASTSVAVLIGFFLCRRQSVAWTVTLRWVLSNPIARFSVPGGSRQRVRDAGESLEPGLRLLGSVGIGQVVCGGLCSFGDAESSRLGKSSGVNRPHAVGGALVFAT
ncbi:hypothetical protein GCM10023088_38160 [Actinomadura verrucosospora]